MGNKWFDDEELKQILGNHAEIEAPAKEVFAKQTNILDDGDYPKQDVETHPVQFEELTADTVSEREMAEMELLFDIPLEVRVLLGSVEKTIKEILELEKGNILSTEKLAGEPVEILVADQVIAKGEIVIIDDKFGVLITEIVAPRERIHGIEGKIKRQKV